MHAWPTPTPPASFLPPCPSSPQIEWNQRKYLPEKGEGSKADGETKKKKKKAKKAKKADEGKTEL